MSALKKNIVANFAGGAWSGLMGLVFVPVYVHVLGIETYGLIGLFATLLAIFGVLDLGLSGTLNRELARLSVQPGRAREMRDILRTLEIPYWLAGLAIGIAVIASSPFIAYRWVNAGALSPATIQTAIRIMGVAIAFQWPIGLYSGGLMGLERQVLLNAIGMVMATVRGAGAVAILWLVSPTPEAYFYWQILVSATHAGLLVFFLWRRMPLSAGAPRFRFAQLRDVWRFAAGLTGISVLSTILMQLDKVILSRMLSLEMFGYYALANVVSLTLYRLVGPVFSAAYPRFTNLVSQGATAELTRLYHQSAQLLSVMVLPAALVVAFFSAELLLLWTGNQVTSGHTHLLVSILVTGTAIHGLMHVPYALQLAWGRTRIVLLANVAFVLLLVPLMITLTRQYGATGAASVWVILNLGYMLICLPLMHRSVLPEETRRWYVDDVGRPLAAALAVAVAGRVLIRPGWPFVPLVLGIAAVSVAALAAATVAAPQLDAVARVRAAVAAIKDPS